MLLLNNSIFMALRVTLDFLLHHNIVILSSVTYLFRKYILPWKNHGGNFCICNWYCLCIFFFGWLLFNKTCKYDCLAIIIYHSESALCNMYIVFFFSVLLLYFKSGSWLLMKILCRAMLKSAPWKSSVEIPALQTPFAYFLLMTGFENCLSALI